ncbi:sugar transport protein MST1-like [Oryza glaberrima]|uniref:Major facilitator superfamily (MFS) profile domain-containing protein n=1 Tax=Oryza glaberrima TaxID=4538 RepID=I1P1J7_ORYGL|nr:sugar transport protein MST1-like [Oryza glaberrima]
MARGGAMVAAADAGAGAGVAPGYSSEITFTVVMSCLMAASGGLIFGYDISITGGLTQMQSFLEAFFPDIWAKMNNAEQDAYCIFDSQVLTTFVSSLYLAGVFACLIAGHVTRRVGRRNSMLIGASLFFVGAILNCAAVNIAMLVIGRILLGFAVGFTNQSAPVYLAEIAPARWRGAFTSIFHFFLNVGMFVADLVNYRANTIPVWGWRLSLGVAVVPAAVILVGAAFIPDTPNSLVLRGKLDEARASLRRIRGAAANIDAELKDIARAAEEDRQHHTGAFRRIVRREYRPHLVMAIAIPVFFELTGMIVVTLFTPLLFYTVGFSSQKAILGSIITDVVSLASIAAAALTVDRYGRRTLFMVGGGVLLVCLTGMAWTYGARLGSDGGKAMPRGYAVAVVALVCLYDAGFGISWGPLKWIIPSEIFPLEVRSAGQSMSEAISLALTFAQTQSFLRMLCSFKFGAFAYNAAWVVVMTAFVALLLPETKGVPIESLGAVWAQHWYWKRFVKPPPSTAAETKQADGAPA